MPSLFKNKKSKDNKKETEGSLPEEQELLMQSLEDNIANIKKRTGNSSDMVIRYIKIGERAAIQAAVIYIDGIVDSQSIQELLVDTMMKDDVFSEPITPQNAFTLLKEDVVGIGDVSILHTWSEVFPALMSGDTLILIDGNNHAMSAGTKGGEWRSIQEPTTQLVVRGSKEGFTESIAKNMPMVRRIIKSPDLWVETMKIGKVTQTDVSMMYINGIANDKIVKEVKQRLNQINIDSILESGYVEQLIEDQTYTTFPTMYHTERPDIVAGNLLEGRIAIFVDGTPFVLIAPAVFIQFFQSPEDYYSRFDIATSIRFLRILIFFISLIAPATYVAITTFHQEMVPTKLLIAIAAQREDVPFPSLVEALIMEVTFEILREAGIRLPRAIGSAVSIVGALVIGQASVQAGIVSPAMVIVVAMTAIASFATPSFAIAISARLIRFVFMIAAATFGFYGIILCFLMMIVHLCSLRSFGVPYMTPLAPFIPSNSGDTIVRMPWWMLRQRPRLISSGNMTREGDGQRPMPPKSRGMANTTVKEGDQNDA
ncbi:spore germination protein [Priestia megaterium]|uniref:spore germination protein n=1 Tax=Priestia megaterium TaxID=1404 RepID=UPI00203A995F|nr:spore germination protein [Priestia megaterium]MCM3182498.1 spore germination protein [Priestia megaterium]MCM3192629.1 spore germination protein [Priestia megaterium]MED3914945.1 spore germination protein [Priestia megaterium]